MLFWGMTDEPRSAWDVKSLYDDTAQTFVAYKVSLLLFGITDCDVDEETDAETWLDTAVKDADVVIEELVCCCDNKFW